jgi:16S rRNA (guanine527-N7)-methyltransferase
MVVSVARQELAPDISVSRETWDRLRIYESLLRRWQAKINLVSNSTMDDLFVRHFADSAQILPFMPATINVADMGSGAGFPGLVLAIQLIEMDRGHVHLIESDSKKCAFLREVIRKTGARATVHRGRIEDVLPGLNVDVVTARALAPMSKLLAYAGPEIIKGALGVFLKGQDIQSELTALGAHSSFKFEIHPSKIDPKGVIVLVKGTDA